MEDQVHEPEVMRGNELAMSRPTAPATINDLAAHDQGVEIIERRSLILETLRQASLKLLMPGDVTLFKTPDGVVTGFVGDQGCDRVKKLWGIQIENLGPMERVDDPETGEFAYRISGDGVCKVTGEVVFSMEGVRYSTEEYAKQKPAGIQRTVAVQKAARANLDGGITRELAGLKSIPVEELAKAWEGSWRKTDMCAKGKGFGSGADRLGSTDAVHGVDSADIPECGVCNTQLVWRNGKDGKPGFFGCKTYQKHPNDKVIVSAERAKEMAETKRKNAAAAKREPGDE